MRELNAKIGRESEENFIGNFGLELVKKEEGLGKFCQEKEFITRNTYCDPPATTLYISRSRHTTTNVIRNQMTISLITTDTEMI